MGHNPTSIIIAASAAAVNRENHRKKVSKTNEIDKNRDSKNPGFSYYFNSFA